MRAEWVAPAIPARYHPGMDAPIQTALPGLPAEHVRRGPSCELCRAELPPAPPGKTGRKQRFCLNPLHGERASCHDIAEALKRLEAVLPPDRAELRKLKQRRLKRRDKSLSEDEQAQMDALLREIGPEYPEPVRRGTKARLLKLANRFNSNGFGAA